MLCWGVISWARARLMNKKEVGDDSAGAGSSVGVGAVMLSLFIGVGGGAIV